MLLLSLSLHALVLLATATTVHRRKDTPGDFAVTINGQTMNPAEGQEIKLDKQSTPLTSKVLFRGIHVGFDWDPSTFTISNCGFCLSLSIISQFLSKR